jgi:broad specificity phosphatase PhoE
MTRFLYLVRHAVYHGPLPRAAQTAELIAASLPPALRWTGFPASLRPASA